MILPTFLNCSALARELPPNFTTLLMNQFSLFLKEKRLPPDACSAFISVSDFTVLKYILYNTHFSDFRKT
jgi:hypothetical protein